MWRRPFCCVSQHWRHADWLAQTTRRVQLIRHPQRPRTPFSISELVALASCQHRVIEDRVDSRSAHGSWVDTVRAGQFGKLRMGCRTSTLLASVGGFCLSQRKIQHATLRYSRYSNTLAVELLSCSSRYSPQAWLESASRGRRWCTRKNVMKLAMNGNRLNSAALDEIAIRGRPRQASQAAKIYR